jgi:hypothetical protein
MNKEIEQLIEQSKESDNGDELATILVKLSTYFYYLSTQMGDAQNEYNQGVVKILTGAVKVAVNSAERQAAANTNSKHDRLRFQLVALQEVMNALKVKIKQLQIQFETTKGEN